MKHLVTIIMALLAFGAAPAVAQEARQFRRGEAAAADPAIAYLLFRLDVRNGADDYDFVLARELPGPAASGREASAPRFDPAARIVRTDSRYPFAEGDGERFYLLAVPPGSYVLAAITPKRMPAIGTCMCMGTLRFDARAGAVTDLGFLLGAMEDTRSDVPELAPLTGSPHWTRTTPALLIMTVRPPAEGMTMPSALPAFPVVRAGYRAVAKFPNHFRTMINRIPAVPGILAYEGDRAIDLQAPTAD